MPVTVTYPGVYIEELFALSISIGSGATAVPVIAGKKGDATVSEAVRVNSWLQFTSNVEFNADKTLHACIRAYFENGGGYCYIVAEDTLEVEVPKLDDVTLLVAAGRNIRKAVNTLCGPGKSLFAILDGPQGELEEADLEKYDAAPHAAVYYPWLKADWRLKADGTPDPIPPSAAVAGAYCRSDRERGVWKAPANVVLKGGLLPFFKVTDQEQGKYNKGKAINMIREFRGAGPMIWGARTLEDQESWRYIPVRRLFDTAQRDIKKAMSSAVFEPNNEMTWEKIRGAIDNYLHSLWKQGGLMGNSPQQAYFVRVGKDTMTEDEIRLGKLKVSIGMSAVRPAEFIILQFTQEVGKG